MTMNSTIQSKRQLEPEYRAGAFFALHAEGGLVQFEDGFDDAQPQAAADYAAFVLGEAVILVPRLSAPV